MLNLTFFIKIFIACLIVGLLSFLNGIDRAKVEREEVDRKLRNLAEFEKEKNDEQR
jgi:hypothetical protein